VTQDQVVLFTLFGAVLILLLSGRVRHDLVAATGLFAAVILGVVPEDRAFSGFSNTAVLVVALVLIASRAFENSGALALVADRVVKEGRPVALHILVIGAVGAGLSAVINNVAALALLMPLDIQAARKAGRPPGRTLMPLAFATILGGMITLIGTPPNIIASTFRAEALGAPYGMFDFAPVGLAVALAGLAFVALVGWRLIPAGRGGPDPVLAVSEFIAELVVPDGSGAVGRMVAELDEEAEKADVLVVGLSRRGRRLSRHFRYARIDAGDVLVVEGPTDGIAAFIAALGLAADAEDAAAEKEEADAAEADDAPESGTAPGDGDADVSPRADGTAGGADAPAGTDAAAAEAAAADAAPAKPDAADREIAVAEAVVRADARIAWRSAASFGLRRRFGVTLLGISRHGGTLREQVGSQIIRPGDVLLLTGPRVALGHVLTWLGAMAINEIAVAPARPWRIALAIGLFAAAVLVASLGLLSFTTAIAIAVAGYAATGLVPPREFYDQIEWPVVVMLACLLPLGEAFAAVGGTALMAEWVLALTAGQPAVVTLVVLMVAAMTLSDVLNNVATMVIVGPLAVATAIGLGVNPDTFLMGVAVATSCAFLTPIGHKNNTLIMGPGGYAFRDYWPMGLPLEILVLAVSVPVLLVVWPL